MEAMHRSPHSVAHTGGSDNIMSQDSRYFYFLHTKSTMCLARRESRRTLCKVRARGKDKDGQGLKLREAYLEEEALVTKRSHGTGSRCGQRWN